LIKAARRRHVAHADRHLHLGLAMPRLRRDRRRDDRLLVAPERMERTGACLMHPRNRVPNVEKIPKQLLMVNGNLML
jgi:hypothetical protein